ncbi:hypothetical protein FACS1894179_06000 [Bacteroidia bacterium]|nr:hypothetical protein FACS1894179_06000 [Bacteroidia bacterium]
MKTDLTDTTFLILVRLDSIQRLENILCITDQLCRYFNTNVIVTEADSHCNTILKSLLNRKVHYNFEEDKDPVLHKTRHFNHMIKQVNTPYIAIWDADIVVDKKAVIDCVDKLRKKEADVAYPYNGVCYDIPKSLKSLYFKKKDIRLLFRHLNKMDFLYSQPLVGGAVFVNKEKYIKVGMENEKHYGWGNDDYDRYERFKREKYLIYRHNICLFHLFHPRNINSHYSSVFNKKQSENEILKIQRNN